MPNARLVPAVCALRWGRSPWDRSSLSLREAYHCETPCLTACDTIGDCFAQRRAGRNGPPLCGDGSQVLMYYTLNRLSTQSSPTRSSVIMILQVLHCPHCQGTEIVRHGQTRQGKQRYRCREQHCASRTFLLDYCYPGQSPAVKQQIVEMAMNASGIRDTARVLHGSTNIVMTELKKGTYTPARERATVPGPASRASGGGDLPLRGARSTAGADLRARRNVE
jgi:transposase-like protein